MCEGARVAEADVVSCGVASRRVVFSCTVTWFGEC